MKIKHITKIKQLDFFGTDTGYRVVRVKDKQEEMINKINQIIKTVNQITSTMDCDSK